MDVSADVSFTSSGITGDGKGPSSTPIPEDADEYSEAFNSDDEWVEGIGDIRLSEDVYAELSAVGGVITLHVCNHTVVEVAP